MPCLEVLIKIKCFSSSVGELSFAGGKHAERDESVWPSEAWAEGDSSAGAVGTALVCVSYRYDERADDNLTTADIIVDRRPRNRKLRYRDMDMVAVSVPYTEKVQREKLKDAGGRWDPAVRLWRARYGDIRGEAALVERIVRV